MSKKAVVWVVELWDGNYWVPCCHVGNKHFDNRKDALKYKSEVEAGSSAIHRVSRYVREERKP